MNDIDFLPSSYRVSRQTRHVPYYRAGAIGLLVAIVVGSAYGVELQKQRVGSQIQMLEVQSLADAPQAAKLRVLDDQCAQMEKTAKLLALLACEPKLSRVLTEVARRTPEGVAITRMQVAKASNPSKRPGDRLKAKLGKNAPGHAEDDIGRLHRRLTDQVIGVEIQGLAVSNIRVAEYLSRLKACPLMERAVLIVSRAHKTSDKRSVARSEFTIQCELLSPLAPAALLGRNRHAS